MSGIQIQIRILKNPTMNAPLQASQSSAAGILHRVDLWQNQMLADLMLMRGVMTIENKEDEEEVIPLMNQVWIVRMELPTGRFHIFIIVSQCKLPT